MAMDIGVEDIMVIARSRLPQLNNVVSSRCTIHNRRFVLYVVASVGVGNRSSIILMVNRRYLQQRVSIDRESQTWPTPQNLSSR